MKGTVWLYAKLLGLLFSVVLFLAPRLAQAQHLASVSFNPTTVQGGTSTQCTVRLTNAGNATDISISNSRSFVQIPSSVTVPQGSQSITFSVATSAVSANHAATVTFTDGTVTQNANLLVKAVVQPAKLSISPSSVPGGISAVGSIHLTNPAPGGGYTVNIASSQPFVTAPTSLNFASGTQDATFPIQTLKVQTLSAATITVSGSGVTVKSGLQVVQTPAVSSVTFPSTKVSARSFITGTVTLDAYAPPAGTIVQLSSDQSSAQTPASVTIAHGHKAATFLITTTDVSVGTTATIGAQVQGSAAVKSQVELVPPGLANSPWPKFHQNMFNTGVGLGSGADGTQKWKFSRAGSDLADTVIGSDGTIYVAAHGLSALDSNGVQKWHCETGIGTGPTIGSDDTIYLNTTNDLVAVYPNGKIKWRLPTEHNLVPEAAAIGTDGTIYVVNGFHLYAVNPDGTQKWTFPIPDSNPHSAPTIGPDGTIYFNYVTQGMYAVNPDGTEKWLYLVVGLSLGAPTVAADGTIYICGSDGTLCAVNPIGTTKWLANTGKFLSSAAVALDGTIYVGSTDNHLYAINPDGSPKWTFLTGGQIYSSPSIAADGSIYFGSNDGFLYAVDPSGAQKWSFQTGKPVETNPAIDADGTIYFSSQDGFLYAIGSANSPSGRRAKAGDPK